MTSVDDYVMLGVHDMIHQNESTFTMTVNELIAELNKYPGDTKIIVKDSENGMVGIDDVVLTYLEDNSQRVIITT